VIFYDPDGERVLASFVESLKFGLMQRVLESANRVIGLNSGGFGRGASAGVAVALASRLNQELVTMGSVTFQSQDDCQD
jgi:hypothetical protein